MRSEKYFRQSILVTAERLIDWLLAIVLAVVVVLVPYALGAGANVQQLAFFDLVPIFDLPWAELWEFLQTLGLTAATARGGIWLWRKLGGDKYAITIWKVLDTAAPDGLSKDAVREEVREKVKEPRQSRFETKFDDAWMKLREKGDIVATKDEKHRSVFRLAVDA